MFLFSFGSSSLIISAEKRLHHLQIYHTTPGHLTNVRKKMQINTDSSVICQSRLLVVVGPGQRVQSDQSRKVDVIFDDHDVTGLQAVGH